MRLQSWRSRMGVPAAFPLTGQPRPNCVGGQPRTVDSCDKILKPDPQHRAKIIHTSRNTQERAFGCLGGVLRT